MSNGTLELSLPQAGGRLALARALAHWRAFLVRVLLPLATAALALAVWQAVVRWYDVPETLLPAPTDIWARLVETHALLLKHAVPTAVEAGAGFLIAVVLGVALAIALAYSALFAAAVYPSVVLFQLIPKIALAPLFVVWLGIGTESRLAFTVFISFFPMVVATEAGLRATPADMLRLCRSLTATPWQVFTAVRLPYAVPYIFSGMKIAVTFAIIGVIVAEFITAQQGLGFIIIFASSKADTALVLAAIVVLCLVGLAFYALVLAAERLMARWYGG